MATRTRAGAGEGVLERNLREKTLAPDFRYPSVDARRALALLDAAQAQFEAIGMTGWIRRADALRRELDR